MKRFSFEKVLFAYSSIALKKVLIATVNIYMDATLIVLGYRPIWMNLKKYIDEVAEAITIL